MRRSTAAVVALAVAACATTRADVVSRPVEYKHGSARLEGVLVFDPAAPGRRPGVLLAHDHGAAAPAARAKAAQLVRLGYVVFSLDLFGKGVAPRDPADAAARLKLAGRDRSFVRQRVAAAQDVLERQPQVDAKRVAAVGYGVGGTAVLELARAKGELDGVVCVHGDLAPAGDDGKNVGAAVLAIVGADDPAIPLTQVAAFEGELRKGGVDWQLIRYGGVGADFTNPQAGKAYDPDAEKRADDAIRAFLAEAFPPAKPTPQPPRAPPAKAAPRGVPDKALRVLEHVDRHGEAMDGYEGGRSFGNFERRLPQTDARGRRIRYREWDVNPLRPGVNRGPERLVTGSNGSAYYTDDHYDSFKKIR
jgi:dienelactone hydrolase